MNSVQVVFMLETGISPIFSKFVQNLHKEGLA